MTLRPTTAAEVAAIVRDADGPLALRGGGTKDRLGRRVDGATPVDLTGLSGVVTYEPEELILIARPGTPLIDIEALLADGGQHLAFEPPHWGDGATLGGTLGVGASGPRRFVAGAARDLCLGMEFVDGTGRVIRAGGRVVKNVTGYDLWRSLVGSYGTLGVMTEICLKLWPRPEAQRTLAVAGLGRGRALARMLEWTRRPEEASGLAYTSVDDTLWARLEGSADAVGSRVEALRADAGSGEILDDEPSRQVWARLREGGGLLETAGGTPDDDVLFRLAVPPSAAAAALDRLDALGMTRCCLDWGGGLLWGRLPGTVPASQVHAVATDAGGTAQRLGHGPEDANDAAFPPLSAGVAALNATLKRTLDPKGLFNPGRMAPPGP